MVTDIDLLIERGKNRLITQHAFYASVLLRRPLDISEKLPTAGIDIRGNITINPQFIADKSVNNMVFLLAHECMHYMLSHLLRCGGRDPQKFNWAADAYINERLILDGVGEFIDGGIRHPGAETLSVDELYLLAPDNPPGGGGGSLGQDLDMTGVDQLSAGQVAEMEAQVKQEVAQAAQSAESVGQLSTSMKRFVKDTLHKPLPWYRHFEQFFTRAAEVDFDFTNPDRRFIKDKLYIPGFGGYGSQSIVLVLDESGSIRDHVLAHFAKHFNDILQACQPEELHILHTTTCVEYAETFGSDQYPVTLTQHASGGTHMPAGIDYALEHYPDAEAILVLTDGRTDFGSPIATPLLWGITTPSIVAPHGETVHIDTTH